jgi:hypothetical protein
MADNIKIVGEILDTQQVPRYTEEDLNILPSQLIKEDFGVSNDYIEYFVYDIAGNLLDLNYNYKDFKLAPNSYLDPTSGSLPIIEIDPVKDLQSLGYSSGEFKVQYNFFGNKISNPNAELFLKEISSDRTELRVGSTILTNQQIEDSVLSIINEYSGSSYFVDYLANFGDNQQAIVVNVALNKIESGYEIFLKLYQPLSISIPEKSTLWIVKEKVNPYIFDINLDKLIIPLPGPQLRGPNFDIEIPNRNNIATSYQNYNTLLNSFQSVSSSYRQLLSLITSQSIDINTDYSNFTNFVFFSSAEQRVLNFYNKIKQIEDLNNSISTYTALTSSYPNLKYDLNLATASLNDTITNFDGFEYYLYFESGSVTTSTEYGITPYPKSTSTLPYTLFSTGSSSASLWLAYSTASANNYDEYNQNNLLYTIPNFIKDDENNAPYITFVNMVGHYFDNIWIYLQAVTDINLANNNLEKGVSKDLVYTVLQSLGTKLYNRYGDSSNDLFLVGKNSGSANFDNNFTPTGSYLNNIPRKDLLAETYKRIYHNLPLLLKTKGTTYGLQTLISTFGITSSILNVKEYGGGLKSDTLQEYNDDKVRIVSNNIVTGNTLSPYTSLQQQPTSSNLFRTNDLHYVDISFSPETQIDTYASASIASSDPTWNIDNYIGDPGYLYSSSYASLDNERKIYYNFNSQYLDYAGFIRLIQYFDSSLFKMIKDFIPARANLSTGVTINSPVLERNKVSYARPTYTSKISVLDLGLNGPTASTSYTSLYTYLTGSKVAYYNGEISGSVINYYSSWTSRNFNPYLLPTSSIDVDFFNHSNFNILLNNVSSSILSVTRKLLQPIYSIVSGTLGLAGYSSSYYAELQDSNLSLESYRLSRHDGVKISSLLYNNYTSASLTYGGDISFGKTAVINKNVRKIGLFTDIAESSFLPGRNRIALKYLVDEYGSLTELNQRNKYWEEIQRTFIAGDYLNVSQFDNQKSSNQKTTDGNKLIFESGYTYYPILYFGKCSTDPKIYFENLLGGGSYLSTAKNGVTPLTISGSSPLGYPLSASYIPNIFNTVIEGSQYFAAGTLTSFPSYSAQETGDHRVQASFDLTVDISGSNQSTTWSLQLYKNGVLLSENEQTFTTSGGGGGGGGNVNISTTVGYTGAFFGHIVRVGSSTNGSTVDITANGSTEVVNYLTTTLPDDGSSISVGFNIDKISPSSNVGDVTSVSLIVNSVQVDSYNRNIGQSLSGTLTGNINRYDTVKIEIIEG